MILMLRRCKLKEVKEYKAASVATAHIYDRRSADGDADPVSDGFDH